MTKRFPYKVLYLSHSAKPGGAEFALLRLLGALDRARVTPIVVFGEDGPAVKMLRDEGIEACVLPLTNKVREVRKDTLGAAALFNPQKLFFLFAYSAVIAAFARRHRVHIIHTNTMKAHIYGVLAGRLARLPVVWHVRDYINNSYFPTTAVKVIRFFARHAPRHVFGVSRNVMEHLQLNDGGRKSTVVLDGLADHEFPNNIPPEQQASAGSIARVAIVGRIARWKGQHVFLEAAAKLINAGCKIRFLIVGAPLFGEEAYEHELRNQVEALGIGSHVEFTGFIRDVPGLLRTIDILVHASITGEPFGQVIIEGMAVAKPVIATCGGGVPEIISHGKNGLLTPMGDSGALADTLLYLIQNPDVARRLGLAGYQHVRQAFLASTGARKVEDVYERLLSNGKPSREIVDYGEQTSMQHEPAPI